MHSNSNVTSQEHSIEFSCIFVRKSSLKHVTTLQSLVAIDILIREKMPHQKHESYKYVLPLKNWITTR